MSDGLVLLVNIGIVVLVCAPVICYSIYRGVKEDRRWKELMQVRDRMRQLHDEWPDAITDEYRESLFSEYEKLVEREDGLCGLKKG